MLRRTVREGLLLKTTAAEPLTEAKMSQVEKHIKLATITMKRLEKYRQRGEMGLIVDGAETLIAQAKDIISAAKKREGVEPEGEELSEAGDAKRRFIAYVGVAEYSGSKEYQWFKVGQGADLTKLMDLVGSKVHGGNMTSHVIEVPSGVRAPKKYKGSGAALIKRVKGKSMGGVGGNLTGRW